MLRDQVTKVCAAAEALADAVEAGELLTAFDNEGNGPYMAIADDVFAHPEAPGPIRRAAKKLRAALLDLESAARAELLR